jgi:hypothetical protein
MWAVRSVTLVAAANRFFFDLSALDPASSKGTSSLRILYASWRYNGRAGRYGYPWDRSIPSFSSRSLAAAGRPKVSFFGCATSTMDGSIALGAMLTISVVAGCK